MKIITHKLKINRKYLPICNDAVASCNTAMRSFKIIISSKSENLSFFDQQKNM